ncbi:trichothecene efflux pump [Colletotrichum higginsianum]|nr:trichothecene efflux pump [Colletotrichum higginsianum]
MTYSVVYVLWPTIVGKVFDENPDAISNAIAWQAAILGGSLWYGMALAGTFLTIGFIENVAITGVTYVWDAQDIGLAFGVLGCLCSLSCAFAQVGFASILD